ncbi:acyl-CoA thioesterase [Novosphingobium naphthalenivorans]|uniref:acyl-CoA thioesterase n=1 Tax=Novosphingobium naphthalenivorans TaxID=273168 RepID=UPI000835F54E|nr:thioesterase family protein [Novosphingobium naphthalenivorans]
MSFETIIKVRFAHVDAAGIVFYPRYFEMLNAAVEDWFEEKLGFDFRTMHRELRLGVPTVKLNVNFISPSEIGDELTVIITPRNVGRSSCAIDVLFTADGRDRLRAEIVLVCMDLIAKRSTEWPEAVRSNLLANGCDTTA